MGGKQRLVKQLLPLVPEHEVYCEVFGGGAALLLNKPRSRIEVLNDIDGNIVNLFMVVRDQPEAFIERCRSLPYSRELFATWRNPILEGKLDELGDPVERAVRFYYVIRSAFASNLRKGWRFAMRTNEPNRLLNVINTISKVSERLRGVYIDHLDFRRCIKNWDSPSTFFLP